MNTLLHNNLLRITITIFFVAMAFQASSQCFQVYNGLGTITNNPYFIGCSGSDYTVYLQPNMALGNYIINWGDGTPNSTGTSLLPPAYVTHTYTATVDTFLITVTDITSGCTVNGVAVLEEPVNASIQIPLGGVTAVCAPSPIDFINSSTNVSPTTNFTWDFGDGTAPLTFGPGNSWQTVTHTYQKNTVSCETVVTLTAENYCSAGNPTIALFQPLMVYDLDTAVISASSTYLCYPDTVVHFANATLKNCLPEGNTAQRYEYWNLGDYWGLGYDSIINWLPFDPPARPGHTIAFPGIGSYSIMMIDSNMCGQDTAHITVTIVGPPTAGISATKDSACVGEQILFSGVGSGANQFYYDFNDGNGFNLYNNNQTFSFNDTGNVVVSIIAGISGTSNVCHDTAQTTIYINPSPVASFSLNANQACDSLDVTISDSTQGAVAWLWDLGNGNTSNVINPPVQTYTKGIYDINLTVTHANGCSDTETNTVSVYPSPVADFSSTSVCQLDSAIFNDASTFDPNDPIIDWSWDFGDGNTSTNQNTTNVYASQGGFNVTLIAATAHCADTISDSVTVEVKPTADFTVLNDSGCSPLNIVTTNLSTGATNYTWSYGNGSGSIMNSPSFNLFNSDTTDTNYVITLVASTTFGCVDTATVPVTVFGGPIAGFTHNGTPSCGPFQVDFVNGSVGASSYIWNFGDSSLTSTDTDPSHVFGNSSLFITNYQVELIAINAQGCTDTISQDVAVYPEPNFPFSTIPDSGCAPLTVTFPAIIGAVLYEWDFGDGTTSTGQTPSHVFYNTTTNDQTFNVQLIATSPFGCKDTTMEVVTVFPAPTANYSMVDSIGCGPLTVNFMNNSINATDYIWSFGDGDTLASTTGVVSHNYINNTVNQVVFPVTLTAITSHGCTDSTIQNVTVHPPVMADFDMDSIGCSPLHNSFVNNTIGANTYYWNFGDGSISNNATPNHIFTNNQTIDTTFNVMLIATSQFGCVDTVMDSVNVLHRANASLSSTKISGCTPLNVGFNNNSYAYDSLYLDFGDGSLLTTNFSNTNHTYINTSTVLDSNEVTLIAYTDYGCNDTSNLNVTVYPPVQAGFTSDTTGCSPLTVTFQNLSTGGSSFVWDFGTGTTSNSVGPTHTFITQNVPSTYVTRLWATSIYGCTDSVQVNITVNPSAVASFNPSTLQGCSPIQIDFNNSSSNYNTLMWDFGDGNFSNSASAVVSHNYINNYNVSQVNTVEIIAANSYGCNDTASVQVEIFPEIEVEFVVDSIGCSPHYVQYNNNSQGAMSYMWDLGNGVISPQANPDETYINNTGNTQSIPVQLIGTSGYGCADTASRTLTIYPQPVATFVASPAVQSFPNTTVDVINNTVGQWSYYWNFANQGTSNLENPPTFDFLQPGEYDITLKISNPYCSDTVTERVIILPPPPVSDFTGSGEGCAPVTVNFTNSSLYGDTYLWDFGDGNTSVQEDPTYTYFVPGTYTVSLTVTGLNGSQTKTIVDMVKVYPNAVANFDFQPLQVASRGDKTYFYNQSANASSFLWIFGDGGESTDENPIYQYTTVGEFPITLIANNQYNCPDTITNPTYITVKADGRVTFPNAFVPNPSGPGGGVYNSGILDNSIFYPQTAGVEQYHLVIYNRWGEVVFETFELSVGWDGYYRGELSAQDVYVWKAEVQLANGEQKVYAGDVTLIQ